MVNLTGRVWEEFCQGCGFDGYKNSYFHKEEAPFLIRRETHNVYNGYLWTV